MSKHEKLIRDHGKCCITEKPLKDSKALHLVQLHIKANWSFPVWGNVITAERNMAIAYVHDDAVKDGALVGDIKYMVETDDKKGTITYHPIQRCRICGCAEDDACIHPDFGACWWLPEDGDPAGPLCSHCGEVPGEATRFSKMIKPQIEAFLKMKNESGPSPAVNRRQRPQGSAEKSAATKDVQGVRFSPRHPSKPGQRNSDGGREKFI